MRIWGYLQSGEREQPTEYRSDYLTTYAHTVTTVICASVA